MNRIVLVMMLVALAGCGKRLRPDLGEAAHPSNYPSAEFYACGKHWVGLGDCSLQPGQDVSTLGLKIQGYHRGRIMIVSEALPAAMEMSYEGSKAVDPGIVGAPVEDIVLGFVVSPEYPGERDQAIDVFSVFGFLHIKVAHKTESWTHKITRTPEGVDAKMVLDVSRADSADIISAECGVDHQVDVSRMDRFTLKLSDYMQSNGVGSCIFQVALVGRRYVKFYSWMSWRYAKKFTPISVPDLTLKDGKLKVVAEPSVTVVALDGAFEIDREAEFKFDGSKPHVLRLLTVKGRTVVGEWSPKEEKWTWMR